MQSNISGGLRFALYLLFGENMTNEIYISLSVLLMIIGVGAGGALFYLAIKGSDKLTKASPTLWALFIAGVAGGLLVLETVR